MSEDNSQQPYSPYLDPEHITLKISRASLAEFHDCLLVLEPDYGEKYPSWEFLKNVLSGAMDAHGTVRWDNAAECWQEAMP